MFLTRTLQMTRTIASVEDIMHLFIDREEDHDVEHVLRALDELETIGLIERNGNPFDDSIMLLEA